ncbi:MAG: type II secretion system protein [Bacilli bacterium]|nr:type II secretion system protein [Bacilli bacterium]
MMKKRGMTLIEVIVASVIFLITFGVVLTTYLLSVKGEERQREYMHFETICYEIDSFSSKYYQKWYESYYESGEYLFNEVDKTLMVYYSSNYEPSSNSDNAKYILTAIYDNFDDDDYTEMKLFVKEVNSERYIIKELVYGDKGGRYNHA